MILFDQGGQAGEGKKVMVESAPPRQSVVRLFFLFFCSSDFLLTQKYWRENHLLDPLMMDALLVTICNGG